MGSKKKMTVLVQDKGPFYILDEARNWPVCGGNKIRKLSYILRNVEAKGLLTFGSKYSSHCLATAYWGACHCIPVRLLVLEAQNIDASRFPHLYLAQRLGAEIVFIHPDAARERIDEERRRFHAYHLIPGGGHVRAGMDAYRDWFCRIVEETPDLASREWVALPYGTGTTALGILYAIHDMKLAMRVIGVSVSRTRKQCLEAAREIVAEDQLKNLMKDLIIDDRFAGQYGKREPHHDEMRLSFLQRSGILPDPIYNIRVVEYLDAERLENGIIINTGGQLNNLTQ